MFSRSFIISNAKGATSSLYISFFALVANREVEDILARARIDCKFFSKDVYATGEDAAQAFFSLPNAVVGYLVGMWREGFESYWLEVGDLDYANFWTYTK